MLLVALARKQFSALRSNPLALAAIISLATHLILFGGWKLNQRFGWLKNERMPAWLQKISQAAPKKNLQQTQSKQQESQLVFIDVDPRQSVKEAPQNAKFYGAANSKAASAKTQDSNLPEIQGKQDKVVKTTENSPSKAQPLQPSPPAPEATEEKEAKPKAGQESGDLAMAKPSEKISTEEGDADKKQNARPRKLSDVKPGLRGEKMKQHGGARQLALDPGFDVKVTSFGDYDREFIAAVQQCWYELLEGRNTVPGKIIVEFRLNYDGRITELKVAENTTGDLMLELICKGAIEKPSPYRKWPTEMRREMQSDSREVRFTFYYE